VQFEVYAPAGEQGFAIEGTQIVEDLGDTTVGRTAGSVPVKSLVLRIERQPGRVRR
jgi:hypothetical protein